MNNYFYDTIYQLRTNEEMTIFEKIVEFSEEDVKLVKDFLQIEFEEELINIPCEPVKYEANAAIWGAKTLYTACQLILYRENKENDLPQLLPSFDGEINLSTILSVDLCLRFLPQIIQETKYIDPDDKLIEILELILTNWHYSGIGYLLKEDELNSSIFINNKCFEQLYVDRVIEKKDVNKLKIPEIKMAVKAALGIYSTQYWSELKLENE